MNLLLTGKRAGLVAVLFAAFCLPKPACGSPGPAPIRVVDGILTRDGVPYRAVGVNYFDGFQRLLHAGPGKRDDRSYRAGLRFLQSKYIPFVRFAACGFYPSEWELYQKEPETYFALLDGFVAEAEECGIGLIPSLFWAYFAIPDLVGEPISAWGDQASKTRAFMRQYTKDLVARYRRSPAIWAWEFGNEFLTEADLPGEVDPKKWVVPSRRTAHRRTQADVPRSEAILDAYREFAQIVRELDPQRPILTGDAAPRVSAWNLARGNGWKFDTKQEWQTALEASNPDRIDTLSVHFYHPRPCGKGYPGYGVKGFSLEENLQTAMASAKATGKPLWLGEFGPGIGETSQQERVRQLQEFLALIEKHQIPLSAYWVYDSINPDLGVWNAVPGGENDFVFDMIAETNERMALGFLSR